jgi:hypothetical protein
MKEEKHKEQIEPFKPRRGQATLPDHEVAGLSRHSRLGFAHVNK